MYLIWKVSSVAKYSQKLKGVTSSLTRNPRHNRFLAMTTNVNQLSVKTFNFPEFQSHKIRWKCSLVKAPLWPNVDILVGCSCHIGGSFTKLHFKVLPYWKLGKNSEKWRNTDDETLKHKKLLIEKCVFHRKSDRNRVGIGPFGVNKIADEPGKRGENFASAGSGWIDDFWANFREILPEIFIKIVDMYVSL